MKNEHFICGKSKSRKTNQKEDKKTKSFSSISNVLKINDEGSDETIRFIAA